jgi:hypothetical protein
MKKYIVLLVTILLLTIMGCKENSTEPTGNYSVSGKIMQEGKPLPNASVSLDKRIDLTAQTNSDGEFSIDNVPKGEYTLSVEKTNSDGSFISKSSELSVTDDIFIQSLLLPKGVKMLEPTEVSANSMHLSWTSTDANDFREYKLYRHTSSGLDENTGTLVHVSTAISDTQFVDDDINPLTTYYYRVYIMNEYARLGGSNIVNSTSLNKNIIQNGSFEKVSSTFPDNWNTWGTQGKFLSNSENAQEGMKSIKVALSLDDWGVNSWGLYQQINPNDFEQGKTYKISFWCKTDSLEEYESISCRFTKNNYWDGNEVIASLYSFVEGPRTASDWQYFSFTLTIPSETPSNYFLTFDLIRAGTMGYTFDLPMISWIDNVNIEKVP